MSSTTAQEDILLTSLPPELISYILSLAFPPSSRAPTAPISRALLPYQRHRLYSQINLSTASHKTIDKLCDTLRWRDPHGELKGYVRKLVIGQEAEKELGKGMEARFLGLVGGLNELESLTLGGRKLSLLLLMNHHHSTKLMSFQQTVQHVSIHITPADLNSDFLSTFNKRFPSCHSLELIGPSFFFSNFTSTISSPRSYASLEDDFLSPPPTPPALDFSLSSISLLPTPPPTPPAPALHSLTLHSSLSDHRYLLLASSPLCSNLEKVKIIEYGGKPRVARFLEALEGKDVLKEVRYSRPKDRVERDPFRDRDRSTSSEASERGGRVANGVTEDDRRIEEERRRREPMVLERFRNLERVVLKECRLKEEVKEELERLAGKNGWRLEVEQVPEKGMKDKRL